MERFIVTNPNRTSFICARDFSKTTDELEHAAMFRRFDQAQDALGTLENENLGVKNFEFTTCDPLCFEEP